MYNYLNGRITEKGIDYIVVECGGVGYHVFVSRPDDFQKDDYTKVFTYLAVREDDMTLYGFKTKEEKNLFLKIIGVSGIGPPISLMCFCHTDWLAMTSGSETFMESSSYFSTMKSSLSNISISLKPLNLNM